MPVTKRSLLAPSATLVLLAPATSHAQWVTDRSTDSIGGAGQARLVTAEGLETARFVRVR